VSGIDQIGGEMPVKMSRLADLYWPLSCWQRLNGWNLPLVS